MGTAILLRPHDCLQGRLPNDALALTSSSSFRSRRNPNRSQTRRRKRSPVTGNTSSQDRDRSRRGGDNSTVVVKGPGANLVMGQVKILKRGEKLPELAKREEEVLDLVLGSTDRLGPDPEMVQKQIRVSDLKKDGIYAGSGFVTSPPPSSVPVPGFLGKNSAAASDLRRLLRLD